MSFSSEIKEELSQVNNFKDRKIVEAEFLGYILTGSIEKDIKEIEFVTENEFNIERFYKILFNLEVEYEPEVKGKVYVARIKRDELVEGLLKINLKEDDDSLKAIVRGAFLGTGSITDPNKQYHVEILFQEEKNADYIANLCKEFGVTVKKLQNGPKFVLYIKESEEISKFLALIGSNKGVLRFEDVRITKEVKNNVNRLVNCETANLNKIVNAAVDQVNDINLIKKLRKYDELPDYLKELAELRLENPDASLKTLGEMLEKPIGKSGVNHRFQKIHEIAEELRR
jgi:DNA-binding protein WhiA